MYVYTYIYIYVYVYIYTYIYIYQVTVYMVYLTDSDCVFHHSGSDIFFFRFLSGHDRSFLYGQVIFEREILFTEHNYVIMSRYTVHHKFTGHFKQ